MQRHALLIVVLVAACSKGFDDYQTKSKRSEAQLLLNKMMKNAKTYFVMNSKYLVGSAGPTPATPCCKGPDQHCPVETSWDTNPVWAGLDFRMDEPARFQYSYQSDGKTVTATAVGDLECTGNPITYTLTMDAPNGIVEGHIIEPTP